MIFQPTNITPSLRGELGNGTVDAAKDLTVSWQVNGNSPLTAFSITLYKNDTASTQVYTTGRLTEGCPFYGTNFAGQVQFFAYTIPAATLAGAGVVNGQEYKLTITQWWSDTDSVAQTSAAAFITRSAPELSLADVPPVLAVRLYTFQANYSQAQGDALNWVRWQIAYAANVGDPFYDSQNIYGTAELKVSYDGFFRENTYAVRCRVQTASGVEADTGWVSFRVAYSADPLTGVVRACQARGKSAVRVEWPAIAYIPETANGPYTIDDGSLTLPAGSSVSWDSLNGLPLVLAAPWSVLWQGALQWKDADIFTLETGGGTVALRYSEETRTLALFHDGVSVAAWPEMRPTARLWVILTPDTLYLRKLEYFGGLYPSATLYPSETLFPQADTEPQTEKTTLPVGFAQGSIVGAALGGVQSCDFFSVVKGAPAASVVEAMWNQGAYSPSYDSSTYLLADFNAGLNAGNLGQTEDQLTGLAIYRRQGEAGLLQHLTDLPLSAGGLYDYGAASQQGPYIYYLFPLGSQTYITEPISSEEISPCFWDWTVLSCKEQEGGGYLVEAEFTFGKNLVSGAVSNNNTPQILENFTRYPTVQLSPVNYRSGSLQSLIGVIDYKNGNRYSDTISLRDAIYDLSTTQNHLFLKNRKGDVLRIRISEATGMETMDSSRAQAQTVTLSWAEVGSAAGAAILGTADF